MRKHEMSLDLEETVYFRNHLRIGRAEALSDAEGSHAILYAIERLGLRCSGKVGTLNGYRASLQTLAEGSALATEIPQRCPEWHIPFEVLYEEVKIARNEALHQGSYARVLTSHAIQLALILEDALMKDAKKVGHFMVRNPVTAEAWQPVSFVRQQMLAYSFSYLPLFIESGGSQAWHLVSDVVIAKFLRSGELKGQSRNHRLATELSKAISAGGLELKKVAPLRQEDPVAKALDSMSDGAVLVVDGKEPSRLVGILTAYDLL